MRDDFLSPTWASEHRQATGAIHALFATIGRSLAWLHAHDYDAPWKRHDAGRA